MKELIINLQRIQRMRVPDEWHSIGNEVYNHEGHYVGKFAERSTAQYIAEAHNAFGLVGNLFLQLWKKQLDRARITRETELDD